MPRSDTRLRDDLVWALAAGSVLGVLDGASNLAFAGSVAGPAASRWVTLLTACLVDAGLLLVSVLLLGGLVPRSRGRVARSVSLFGLLLVAGALTAEDLDARARLSVSLPVGLATAAACALLVGLVYGIVGARPRAWLHRAFVLLALGAALVGLRVGPQGARGSPPRPNMLLVSLDTLRADHLGCYGYERDTSPHLDALAEAGVVFENAQSPSNWTLPSHASILTGLDPTTHGALDSHAILAPEFNTLAEGLFDRGYATAAFVGNGPYSYIGAERGLDQGFEEYHHRYFVPPGWYGLVARGMQKLRWRFLEHRIGNGTAQVSQAIHWLRRRDERPFFLFLHLFDIHSDSHELPYESPAPFDEYYGGEDRPGYTGCDEGACASELLRGYASGEIPPPDDPAVVQHMIDLYDAGIAYTDHELGRFFDALRELDLWDSTVVVVTADHGEAFFEHGVPLHNDLHAENVNVPLLVRIPGQAPGRVPAPSEVRGVAAMLLELASDEPGGQSRLLRLARDLDELAPSDDVVFYCNETQVGVRRGKWKLIRGRGDDPTGMGVDGQAEQLYDLEADPVESTNLVEAVDASTLEGLRGDLREAYQKHLRLRGVLLPDGSRPLDLPESELEELRSLGYAE